MSSRFRAKRRHGAMGFTLIEVMVALAIVALAVPALLFTLDQQVDGTAHLRDRSLAQLVAANRLEELRLAMATGGQRLSGRVAGEETLFERDWYWSIESERTELEGFSRIEIAVAETEGDDAIPVYTLVALMANVAEEDE